MVLLSGELKTVQRSVITALSLLLFFPVAHGGTYNHNKLAELLKQLNRTRQSLQEMRTVQDDESLQAQLDQCNRLLEQYDQYLNSLAEYAQDNGDEQEKQSEDTVSSLDTKAGEQ